MREMFLAPIRHLILVIVGFKGEAHGYEILKEIEKISQGTWKPSHGNLYNMLGKMVEEGLLEPKEEYHGRRKLVKYTLTEKGWDYLREANELALQSLYISIQYHEALRKKLIEKGYRREIAVEVVEEYLSVLDEICELLDEKRKRLRKRLEELNASRGTPS
ncbi:ParR family transcriptional regulator [Thermococcus sp. 4557]|nr:ParR family transcriptional regulator [Thermococcus sp. 4557]